jgi:hypothetical protein
LLIWNRVHHWSRPREIFEDTGPDPEQDFEETGPETEHVPEQVLEETKPEARGENVDGT